MKSIRRIISVCGLALFISFSSYAGETQTPGKSSEPTPAIAGETQTPGYTNSVVDLALALLALF